MNGWVRVGTRGELLPGEFRGVVWMAIRPLPSTIDGDLAAIEDVCTHDGGELAGGPVEGFEVERARHGARFDLRTGAVTCPPATSQTFSVRGSRRTHLDARRPLSGRRERFDQEAVDERQRLGDPARRAEVAHERAVGRIAEQLSRRSTGRFQQTWVRRRRIRCALLATARSRTP